MTAQRTFQPVRRDSFDVDDPRAQVFRPIEGGIKFVEVYLEVFDEWANIIKKPGEQHELNANCRKVLEKILRKCTDFKTGVCEPCIDTLMRLTRLARATVVRCLKMLARHRFIDWIRRTIRTDIDPGEGPQVKQVSNAYFFDLAQLPKRVLMAIQQKLRKKQVVISPDPEPRRSFFKGRQDRRRSTLRSRRSDLASALANAAPHERAAILYPNDPEAQRLHNEMLFGSESASSETSLNPSPRI